MKSIGLLVRQNIIKAIVNQVKEANACYFIGFTKISAHSLTGIRNNLRSAGAKVFVAKNSLFKKAFNELNMICDDAFDAEIAAVLVTDADIVKSCKILVDFKKENEFFTIKGGFIKDKKISVAEINDLAKLPSREVLLGQAVGTMIAPLTGFLAAMNQVILRFVWTVEEIKKKKA